MLALLLAVVSIVCSVVSIVCFIWVIVSMFQNDDSNLAIICLLTILCGIGGILAFIFGWVNVDKYGIRAVMLAWSIAFALGILCQIGLAVLAPEDDLGQVPPRVEATVLSTSAV